MLPLRERRGHPRVPHLLGEELDVRVACPERPAEHWERLEAGAPRIGDAQMAELAGRRALGVLGSPVRHPPASAARLAGTRVRRR